MSRAGFTQGGSSYWSYVEGGGELASRENWKRWIRGEDCSRELEERIGRMDWERRLEERIGGESWRKGLEERIGEEDLRKG